MTMTRSETTLILVVLLLTACLRIAAAEPAREPAEALVGNNSVARLDDGTVLLLLPTGELRVSRNAQPITMDDFAETIPLFGKGGSLSDEKFDSVAVTTFGNTVHVVSKSKNTTNGHSAEAPITSATRWQKQAGDAVLGKRNQIGGKQTFVASETPDGAIRVEWREGDSVKGSELLKGRAAYRPTLASDEHGVVWLFAVDRDQRGIFYRRFLGSGFSPEAQCAGAPGVWKQSLGFSVQPRVSGQQRGFAILRGEYLDSGEYRYRFDDVIVPRYSVTDSRHILFLDMLEVAEIDGLDQRLSTAVRSDANPLALNGSPDSADAAWVNYPMVLHENGKFRMWYSTNTNTFERNMNIAYAESEDGVHWTKPELGIVEFNGSKKNNLLFPNLSGEGPPSGYSAAVSLVIRDDNETDPQRRYKMVFESGFEKGTSAYLTWSPDGIKWDTKPAKLWGKAAGKNKSSPGFHPWLEPLISFFYDPITPHPDYRWKIYGQDGYAGHPHADPRKARNVSLAHGATPYDYKGFTGNPVIDPRTGHEEDQIHGGLVQPYHGLYVGLYQHWWGDDWYVDLRLAISRDGIHFVRIHPDKAVLPLGAPGQWDSGMLCTPPSFFVHDGKIWLYYRGSVGTLATGRALNQMGKDDPKIQALGEAWRMKAGLSRLREDGFAFLTVKRMQYQPQQKKDFNEVPKYDLPLSGRVLSIPIDATGIDKRSLHVNFENFAPGFANIKALLRDGDTGAPIPGYTFAESDAVTQPSTDQKLSWKGSSDLSGVKAQRVRVEFQLFGTLDSPQLYSFWFADRSAK
jgi:hypothetical protein